MVTVANDNTKSLLAKVWDAAKPWVTGRIASATASAVIVGAGTWFVTSLQKDVAVGDARMMAAREAVEVMTKGFGEKTARRVEDVATVAAAATSTACLKAIEDENKRRASVRRPAAKPKETGSIF
ncbi:MAG: hypothetical protein Q7T86_03080 [Hyphomicrobiaceae bacterium]|nr:hypothetical protein [Hyphomicrobiaceae bacterium]